MDNANAYVYLAQFNKAARRAGWKYAQMKKILDDAKSGDYDHLVKVIRDGLAKVAVGYIPADK